MGNFKRFDTIPNSEILLNHIRKRKYLTDQFQLCFCFCIANAKQLYFISALATQLAFLWPTCSCYVCFVFAFWYIGGGTGGPHGPRHPTFIFWIFSK